jgi:hypothetical protein
MSSRRSGLDDVRYYDVGGRGEFVQPDRTRANRIVRWPRKVGFCAPFVRIALQTQFSGVIHL